MGRTPRSGDVIDDRYAIEQLAGSGGMGQVYQARDRRTGKTVALKVMHDAEKLESERFAREARILATLAHPGIVRYIDSGTTGDGEPYLVMEWLTGETLSARLQRTQMTLAESLALGRRVASALGAIHRRGIVHRDVKPSNLFLRGGAIDEVALIDFGMARRPIADPKLTVTGTMLGTPGYVAPEQVYSVPNLDGRADIFSLGCVLYRCLAGRAPFRSHDGLRMLLNRTPDQLPRLREIRPSIPPELDALISRMLSYSPDDRPHSGDAVAAELMVIEESDPTPLSVRLKPRPAAEGLMAAERRLTCLVMARPLKHAETPLEVEGRERAVRGVIERHRGRLEALADGSLLVILSGADAATDLATRAARCALAIRPLLGNGPVAVVTGREALGPFLPDSELLYRAVDLLESTVLGPAIPIDELTSALIKSRFDTGSSGRRLRAELRDADRLRLPFDEPVAFVGRDQELAQIEAAFEQCVEERVASMVLLTGATGAGKTRLGHELVRRLEARGPLEVWLAEADALNAGSAYGVLARLLRSAFGLADDDPPEARRDKIRARLARRPHADSPRLAELLGELADAPPGPGGGAAPPSEQAAPAFLGFLGAECAAQPVVIVLEDLHWGDLASIKLIDGALAALADRPLMVLALARTTVHEIFPKLWADRSVQEIRLRKLSRRAGEQLVRRVLGEHVGEDTVKLLVERSEGHASYLEEMTWAAAEGKGAAIPPMVLAMVQARLEKLDPAARRVLRAASIFGETFWRGGVEALVGTTDTAAWLAELLEQDVVAIKEDRRFPDQVEYRFRHPLVQEAAYAMITEDDRVTGHWLARQWLERAGETDAKILDEHLHRWGRGGATPGSRA